MEPFSPLKRNQHIRGEQLGKLTRFSLFWIFFPHPICVEVNSLCLLHPPLCLDFGSVGLVFAHCYHDIRHQNKVGCHRSRGASVGGIPWLVYVSVGLCKEGLEYWR